MVSLRMPVVLLIACASTASAQSSPTGVLTGRVMDQSQGAMPGVAVTAVNAATNDTRTDVTNTQGLYRLPALPVGTYELRSDPNLLRSSRPWRIDWRSD